MFGFIKDAFKKIYDTVTTGLSGLFSKNKIDKETLIELEKILITADTGSRTTKQIVSKLETEFQAGKIEKGPDLKLALSHELKEILDFKKYNPQADIYLLVGINGSGKTTFASKLANWLKNQQKKILLVAGDTFRAAATEQLKTWAQRLSMDIVIGNENQDPGAVVYSGCEKFKTGNYDCLIIDTAGRLQTKVNLMKELEKIRKIITKQLAHKIVSTLLTVDAMLGQNSFDQAKIFHESTNLDGIVLTKMDGTGKGGIVFSISQELKIPVAFISFGEQPDQIDLFNPDQYIDNLLK